MLSRLKSLVTNEQRLVWSELLQWMSLFLILVVILELAMAIVIWIVSAQLRPFLHGHNADILPSFLVASGLLTIALAALGYNGAWYSCSPNIDDRFYALKRMMWFELLGCLIVVLDIVLGITCITIVHGDILWAAQRGMKSDMAKYSSEPLAKFKVDVLQNKYRCCGVASYRDWFSVPWQQYTSKSANDLEDSAPWSCCKPEAARPCVHFLITQNRRQKAYTYPTDLTLHTEGCAVAITKYLGHHMLYICGGVMLIIGFIMIVITQWMRVLETSLTNAYTLGDPEATTWGYILINYGPDLENLYEEIDQEDGGWGSDFDDDYAEPIYDEVAQEGEEGQGHPDYSIHGLPIPGTGGAYYNSNSALPPPPHSASSEYTPRRQGYSNHNRIPHPPPLPENGQGSESMGIPPPPPLPFM